MRRIFLFFLLSLFCLKPSSVKAQLLDGLFAEDELEDTSNIDAMQKTTADENQAGASSGLDILPPPLEPASPAPVKEKILPPVAPQAQGSAMPSSSVASPAPTVAPATNLPPPKLVRQPIAPAQTAQPTLNISRSKPKKIKPAKAPKPALPSLGSGRAKLPSLGGSGKSLSLFEMRAKATGETNTNVAGFDIAGLRLKMTPEEILEISEKAGFKVKIKEEAVPELDEWKYSRTCLDADVFVPQRKKECIKELARKNQLEYVRRLVLESEKLEEEITVEFASPFAKNQAYYIKYFNKGDHSLGATKEAHYINSKRRNEFLSLLIKKYGVPDDEQQLLWGGYGVGATFKADLTDTALDVLLVLEDVSISAEDFENMSISDSKEKGNPNFSF